MNIVFISAEEASCPYLQNPTGHEEHISQPHLSIRQLPCPSVQLSISSFPINTATLSEHYNPKAIANFWLQLLSIHVQNGNFWNYADAIKPAKTETRPLSAQQMAANASRDEEKKLLYIRYRLQKGFLQPSSTPPETELPNLSDLIKMLEDDPEIDVDMLRKTEFHKVLGAICEQENIPGDEEFGIRRRCGELVHKWMRLLETPAQPETETIISAPPEPVEKEEHESEKGEMQMPLLCITQLTPAQCANLESMARECNPPLDRAVVDLMCILPCFSPTSEREAYQVAFIAKIAPKLLENADRGSELDNRLYHRGPTIPPQMLQLTKRIDRDYGTDLFVDTRTGESIELKDYEPMDGGVDGAVYEVFDGPRRPIEELLREWIENFLTLKWIPIGAGDIIDVEKQRYMDAMKYKWLMQEYNWPQAFPLPEPLYYEFLERKEMLRKTTFENNKNYHLLSTKWRRLSRDWYMSGIGTDQKKQENEYERIKALDRGIYEALKYHEDRNEDREYSIAADVPMLRRFLNPLSIHASTSMGDGWRVDIKPEMIIETFNDVLAAISGVEDQDTRKMREIIEKAYQRARLAEQGIYEEDFWEGEDDDSTSDYEPKDEESTDDEGFESGEDGDDLDVEVLEADLAEDIENIKIRLAVFHEN